MSKCFGCKDNPDKIGILFAQLGTPAAPTAKALRPYLRQFLSDRRVIEVPKILWWLILNLAVLPRRPKRSAALYKRIWTPEGSPLTQFTKRQTELVHARLREIDPEIECVFGMRYGAPSLESGIDTLIARGCRRILLFPMYPQYAAATTASTYDAVFPRLLKERWVPTLKVAAPYYRNPHYLDAMAARINESLAEMNDAGRTPTVMISFHGVPREYIDKGDPYCCQCTETTAALLPRIVGRTARIIQTFQSRFGSAPWLQPYTDETIEKLAAEGVKDLAIVAPGFTADCLETLDELGNEAREQFMEEGGEKFTAIPCLNDHPRWIEALTNIVKDELGDWLSGEKEQPGCATNGKLTTVCPDRLFCEKGILSDNQGPRGAQCCASACSEESATR